MKPNPPEQTPPHGAPTSDGDAAVRAMLGIIEREIQKPSCERDETLINTCIDTILEIRSEDASLSQEELAEGIRRAKAKMPRPKKRKRLTVMLIAVCAVLILAAAAVSIIGDGSCGIALQNTICSAKTLSDSIR